MTSNTLSALLSMGQKCTVCWVHFHPKKVKSREILSNFHEKCMKFIESNISLHHIYIRVPRRLLPTCRKEENKIKLHTSLKIFSSGIFLSTSSIAALGQVGRYTHYVVECRILCTIKFWQSFLRFWVWDKISFRLTFESITKFRAKIYSFTSRSSLSRLSIVAVVNKCDRASSWKRKKKRDFGNFFRWHHIMCAERERWSMGEAVEHKQSKVDFGWVKYYLIWMCCC